MKSNFVTTQQSKSKLFFAFAAPKFGISLDFHYLSPLVKVFLLENKKKKYYFLLYFPRLLLPLQSKLRHCGKNKSLDSFLDI